MTKPAAPTDTTNSPGVSPATESSAVDDSIQTLQSGFMRIIARNAQKRLEIEGGSTDNLARILMANGQSPTYLPSHWQVDRVPGAESFVTIRNRNSGMYLTVELASQSSGANLVQSPFIGGAQNQQFLLVGQSGGYFALRARHSQRYVEVFGGLSDAHPPLVQSATSAGGFVRNHMQFRFDAI